MHNIAKGNVMKALTVRINFLAKQAIQILKQYKVVSGKAKKQFNTLVHACGLTFEQFEHELIKRTSYKWVHHSNIGLLDLEI
jgi:glutaminase